MDRLDRKIRVRRLHVAAIHPFENKDAACDGLQGHWGICLDRATSCSKHLLFAGKNDVDEPIWPGDRDTALVGWAPDDLSRSATRCHLIGSGTTAMMLTLNVCADSF